MGNVLQFPSSHNTLSLRVEWSIEEGTAVSLEPGKRQPIAIVTGNARSLLQGERVALNTLARASGIATR